MATNSETTRTARVQRIDGHVLTAEIPLRKSRRMIADAIEEAIFDAFEMEPPAGNSRPVRQATKGSSHE